MSKKVLVFSSYDHGGAGESAYRIAKAIEILGYECRLVVKTKTKPESFVVKVVEQTQKPQSLAQHLYRSIKRRFLPRRLQVSPSFDPNYYFYNVDESYDPIPTESLLKSLPYKPDIIILAWVSDFINTRLASTLRDHTGATVHWLMTDMAPLTGGCHYAWDCKGYTKDCSSCPAIMTDEFKQKAKQNLALKIEYIQSSQIQVLAGSGWTEKQARQSTLFKNQPVIPVINGLIDFTIFNNANRGIAKQIFHIESNAIVLFSGSTYTAEKRKGIGPLTEALNILFGYLNEEERVRVKVLVAGRQLEQNHFISQIPFKVIPIDFIKDERLLSLAYQASDVFVCPSLEDSGPMMVNEALACGTPVVGFEMGLLDNMVKNSWNGQKAILGDTAGLANAILQIIKLSHDQHAVYSSNAIEVAKRSASLEALSVVMKQLGAN